MARRTATEAQQTRLRILNAAAAVFCRQGISQTTLEDVARHAGVTRGAVYWHFAGKQELLGELLDGTQLPMEQMALGKNLAEDCRNLAHALLEAAREPGTRRVMQLLMQTIESGAAQSHLQRRCMSARRRLSGYLSQVVRRAFVAGELAPSYSAADIAPLAMALRAGVNGLLFEMLLNPRVPERHVIAVVHLLFDALQRSTPPRGED